MKNEARINEIFLSIQGEGLLVGKSQIFIRFAGCNLKCKFCDTQNNSFRRMHLEKLLKNLSYYNNFPYHSISLTGGEPLLQVDFISSLLKEIKFSEKKLIYLDTNGTMPYALSKIIDALDYISVDFKLSTSTGEKNFFKEHQKFLEISFKKKVFVKIVIVSSTTQEELEKSIKIISKIDRKIPLILQPVTPIKKIKPPTLKKFLSFYKLSLKELKDVRIIPQIHHFLGWE